MKRVMIVACERSEMLAAGAAEVAGAVQATLARGQPSYSYHVTYASDDQLQFRAIVRTKWVSLFTLLIRLDPEGPKTRVTVSTYPSARAERDIFDYCNRLYFTDLLGAVTRLLGLPGGEDPASHDRTFSRWEVALAIFRTFGLYVVSLLIVAALLVQAIVFPSSDTKPLWAALGVLVATRVIRSIIAWLNWRSDPQNASLPRAKSTGRFDGPSYPPEPGAGAGTSS